MRKIEILFDVCYNKNGYAKKEKTLLLIAQILAVFVGGNAKFFAESDQKMWIR